MYELEDNRRSWLKDIDPSVLERVSRQPLRKQRRWRAVGDIRAAHKGRRQHLLDEASKPMRMRQQYLQSQMPMSDREKMGATFGQQVRMAMLGITGKQQAAGVARGQEVEDRDLAYKRGLLNTIQKREWDVSDTALARQNRLADAPQLRAPPDPVMMRGEGGDMFWQQPGQPIPQGATRPGTYQEPQIPSVSEQEAMILGQFELGSPEWIHARMQIEEIKRTPVDPMEQMLAMQRLARGALKTGWYGAQGEEMETQKGVGAFAQRGLNALMNQSQAPQPAGFRPEYESFQIGQIIERGGRRYVVVGFADDDHEPLLEPVQ